jgi:hypothetical protein
MQFQYLQLMEWKGEEEVPWMYVTACEYVGGGGRRLSSGWLGWFDLDGSSWVGSSYFLFLLYFSFLFVI